MNSTQFHWKIVENRKNLGRIAHEWLENNPKNSSWLFWLNFSYNVEYFDGLFLRSFRGGFECFTWPTSIETIRHFKKDLMFIMFAVFVHDLDENRMI